MAKYIIKISVVALLTSCATINQKTITGYYRTKGSFEMGSSIRLNKDSSFVYNWQGGLVYGETKGKWKIKDKELILNSDLQPENDTTPSYYLIEAAKRNSNKIRFDLFFPDSTEVLPAATGIMFENGVKISNQLSNMSGQMSFQKQDFDSIKISFVGLRDIIITDSINDYLKIAAVENFGSGYEFFTNEIWNIRHKSLIDYTFNRYYYEKRFHKIE
ncbi:hypothetical protein [Saccharicrinis sp. 156]|uniref:hypothetical protein n=1 Tax=Saccharicrinis sp. 156 TaxID=3417574 RepID=UPI003D351C7C